MPFELYQKYKKRILHLRLFWGGKWKCSSREDEKAIALFRERDDNAG